jgi:hypothetical protein
VNFDCVAGAMVPSTAMAIAAATDFDTTFDMRDPSSVEFYDCRGGSDGGPKKQSKLR